MYILLEDNKVKEIIPDIAPIFPGIPIEARYTAEFVAPFSMWRTGQRSSRIGFMTLKRRPFPHPLNRSRNQNLK